MNCHCIVLVVLWAFLARSELFPGEVWETGYIGILRGSEELFYYLFKSRAKDPLAPLVVWLDGGPGCAGIGPLMMNGPYGFDSAGTFKRNPHAWNERADLLFLDQPIGTGFSTVRNKDNLCHNSTCAATDVVHFLRNFIAVESTYWNRPLYLSGNCYGAHIGIIVAAILVRDKLPGVNLQGIALANGFFNVQVEVGPYPDFMYENGMIGSFKYCLAKTATFLCQLSMGGLKGQVYDLCNIDKMFGWLVHIPNPYDIRDRSGTNEDKICSQIQDWLNSTAVRLELHAHTSDFKLCNGEITSMFYKDQFESVSEEFSSVLEQNVKVLVFTGDVDYECNWRAAEAFVHSVDWVGKEAFALQPMLKWTVNNRTYGEVNKLANFEFYRVYQAGHFLPYYQPLPSLELLHHLIHF